MRCSSLLSLAFIVGLGCTQMRYSNRYQEVRIDSNPQGATVIVEGEIEPLKPVAIKTEEGMMLAHSSPVTLKTPIVLILDKECREYKLKVTYEGYPEFEKTLKTRFAFHPYLIILFPIVPFWSKYETKKFDDVMVDFKAYEKERTLKVSAEAKERLKRAEKSYEEKKRALTELVDELMKKEKELADLEKRITELEGRLKGVESSEKTKKVGEERKRLSEQLTDMKLKCLELKSHVDDLKKRKTELEKEEASLKSELEKFRSRYEELSKEQETEEKKR